MSDDITIRAREVARCLTYNDDKPQAAAKHLLLELAHRLDVRTISTCRQHGRLAIRDGLGRVRPLSLRERLKWRLFGVLPPSAGEQP
jgi:hypothetical protein